ncbi:MAG TPA: SDR family NAD(P)-dependent oxidoreductase [Pseudolabrys sp.]
MLSEKCALVTGSTAGLGYAIAESLARAGARVILNGLAAPGQGEAAAARLSADTGYEAAFDGADLRDVGAIERMIRGGVARFGTIDIVVNNAVVRHFKPIQAFTAQEWDTSLAVNLSAAFHCVRLTLPRMLERRWGRIINMSSIYGARGVENRADYVTAKTALLGFTRAIAAETAKTGVTCNAVAPGTVPSPAITERIAAIAAAQKISIEQSQNPSGSIVAVERPDGIDQRLGIERRAAIFCQRAELGFDLGITQRPLGRATAVRDPCFEHTAVLHFDSDMLDTVLRKPNEDECLKLQPCER